MSETENIFWKSRLKDLGDHIQAEFPGLGYVTILMPFNNVGNASYISNASRESVVNMLKSTVLTFEKREDRDTVGDFTKSDEQLIQEWKEEFYEKYANHEDLEVESILENQEFESVAIGWFVARGATPQRALKLYFECIERGIM